jgi:4-alpha-glucanotransferase
MRGSGILLHISSLPSPYGIGTMGKDAFEFIDFLKKSRQKYWQVLPMGPTSYGDSPYQTLSVFAGNPYFIDLDILREEGLLRNNEYVHLRVKEKQKVDFEFQYHNRFNVLKLAYNRFIVSDEYLKFIEENIDWINDYALFMAIKSVMPEGNWQAWDEPFKRRDEKTINDFRVSHENDINYWKFIQFKFFEQWHKLKDYANKNGVEIIGDMPIYVAYDSSDVWANPRYWQLDGSLNPTLVAGVPPDNYAKTGQLWGNPIYDYALMENEGFQWWIKRIKESFKLFDILRIDHFRGFESYYAVKFSDSTAEFGSWIKGPGVKLFNKVKEVLGDVNIIAEDLGFLTEEVYEMLRVCGYPGMKILQFGFSDDGDSEYAPHNYTKNSIVYPGTHDNQTLKGWLNGLSEKDRNYYRSYLNINKEKDEVNSGIIECFKSVAEVIIIPIQDYLNLGDEARFNIPSTLGDNWIWRINKRQLTDKLSERISGLVSIYRR